MKKLIIASTSTIYENGYLEYILPKLSDFFKGLTTILFIPYAIPGGISYDEYTEIAKKAFAKINIEVTGIHQYKNPKEAVKKAKGIFVGGGNTFELMHQIYTNGIFDALKTVVENGTPYFGTSAGSNICGISMKNTNDMPIVQPVSFRTFGFIPFNINAHYLDPILGNTHMGETRETRIKEFHVFNDTPVLGLREGSWLEVTAENIILKGKHTARLFLKNQTAFELESESNVINLLL